MKKKKSSIWGALTPWSKVTPEKRELIKHIIQHVDICESDNYEEWCNENNRDPSDIEGNAQGHIWATVALLMDWKY